jgi:hypothetical protein
MLLQKLIQGLGALSLVHLAVAVEDPVLRRTNETVTSDGVDHGGLHEDHERGWWCAKTVTETC